MIESFTCFYCTPPFWAIDSIDLEDPESYRNLTSLMSEEVFQYEHEEFQIRICRDGMIMLKIYELEDNAPDIDQFQPGSFATWWGKYLEYLNCLYLFLDSSLIESTHYSYFNLFEVTNKDVIRVRIENGQIKGAQLPPYRMGSVYQMLRYPSLIGNIPLKHHPDFIGRPVFDKPLFDLLIDKFLILFNHNNLVPIFSGISKSLCEYKVANYPISLILSWFIIELAIIDKWEKFLKSKNQSFDGIKRINKDRKKTLTGRDYPISVILNMLELNGILSFDSFRKIDKIRDCRNKIVHKNQRYVCTPDDCILALDLAVKLSLDGYPLTITLNTSRSAPGP